MSSIGTSNIWTEVPEPVSKAVEAFGLGELGLSALCDLVAGALKNDPATAEPIHELLDEELKARNLTIADYGELVEIVGAVVSEHIPTEASGKTPEESGIYRVIDEHTLIPTNITDWGEDGSADAEGVEKEGDADTHLFELKADPQSDGQDKLVAAKPVEVGPGTVLRERFRLEEEVARGSMGIVYRAVDLIKLDAGAMDPQVAIKVVSPEFADNRNALRTFQNEVANTQHLSHPHIIHLFELDCDDGCHFITMEWLEGKSLAELLDDSQGSALEPVQTYAIIEQLCDAMIYAHEHGVVHADIKPGNVFLLETGEVKLIDFGIAKADVAWQGKDSAEMDKFQAVALTPAYAGCERLEHAAPNEKDDLYSLACLIYRLLAGRRVFGSLNALEAEEQGTEVVAIGGMDDKRRDALAKALAFRREDRQASVREFADEFGRRLVPREPDAEIWEQAAGDTARLPALDVDEEIQVDDEETVLSEAADDFDVGSVEFDFSSTAGSEGGTESDLHVIFEAAARGEAGVEEELAAMGQGEEIVLSSGPDPVAVPFELPPPQIEKVKQRRRRKSAVMYKKAAASVAAAVVLVLVAWLWSGGDEKAPEQKPAVEPLVQNEVISEPIIEPIIEPIAEPVAKPAPVVAPLVQNEVISEPIIEPVIEPIAEPVAKPAPVVAPLVQNEVISESAIEPMVEPAVEAIVEPDAELVAAQLALTEAVVEPEVQEVVAAEIPLQAEFSDDSLAVPAELAATAGVEEDSVGSTESESPMNDLPETDMPAMEGLIVGGFVSMEMPAANDQPAPEQAETPAFDPNEAVALSELEFVKYVEPQYPSSSLGRRYEGTVVVEFRVDTEGSTFDIEVVENALPGRFRSPSIAAVKKWRFKPYLNDGRPVEVLSRVSLRFAN